MFAGRNMMFASAAFSPLSLSPALWLDASDASTLYDATTGGSLVAADGAIARWEDKSGNARHATQSTGVRQPLRKTAVQNGNGTARFDGANDQMDVASMPWFSSKRGTIIIVAKSTGVYGALLSTFYQTAPDFELISTTSGTKYFFYDGAATRLSAAHDPTSFFIKTLVRDADAGGKHYRDSSLADTITIANTQPANNPLRIAAIFYPPNGLEWYNGDIAEILVFPTALADADRQRVERYLGTKWGITVA